ncbi:DUF1415 domain-containing protein [Alteromonas sp. BL110]|uniref:DUF1415 domain-containing protein n=1 Tax=Alteromonas sp. BL110 TaxID=1714845 RepID=UPI000E49E629|nr:DUF1415 domain-containing protein [Alteromonas sp. BL110]AXT39721.1 DUF1415 domain-containing protein [Alteromonas sp. BL110]RKM81792.1 DUF1415 family protein [Alteromonas sp. BL110]
MAETTSPLCEQHVIDATLTWVDDIVITHNFCPFARYVRTPNQIRCKVIAGDAGDVIQSLYDELRHLEENESTATTLIALTHPSIADFNEYLDVLAISDNMLHDWGYSGTYQLASFHPDYLFDGSDLDDAENYTNRSPYPLLHLIREADITRYMKKEADAEKIFSHNIEKARALGCPYFENMLEAIKKDKPAQ